MSLSSEPANNTSERFSSPDLRLRTSTALWGPLQLSIVNHREGVELGYQAGEAAYEQYGQGSGRFGEEALRALIDTYLDMSRYRPRTITPTILAEWKAMFLLGWTAQALSALSRVETPVLERSGEYQSARPVVESVRTQRDGWRERR